MQAADPETERHGLCRRTLRSGPRNDCRVTKAVPQESEENTLNSVDPNCNILRSFLSVFEKHWVPFGPGWLETWLFPFPSSRPRIYRIVYQDLQARVHDGHVKTSIESGVDVTYDRIIEDSAGSSLEDENEGLGRRIAELERVRNRGV